MLQKSQEHTAYTQNKIKQNWKEYMSTTLTVKEEQLAKEAQFLMLKGNDVTDKIKEACREKDKEKFKLYLNAGMAFLKSK